MIRYLDDSGKRRCRSLWNQAFPQDSEAFVDYYFNCRTTLGRVLVKESGGGDILTMAHLNPYEVKVRDKLWRLDYIVGVATDKDSRHQGHMRDVLMRMLSDMHEAGTPFCYLMPASADIYRPFGFAFIFDQPCWKLTSKVNTAAKRVEMRLDGFAAELRNVDGRSSPGGSSGNCVNGGSYPGRHGVHSAESLDTWINRWLERRYEVYAVRGPLYMHMLQQELDSENGHVYGWFDQNGLGALEAFWGLEKPEQRFLYCDRDGWTEPLGAQARPAIMARVTNVGELAKVISMSKDCPGDAMEVTVNIRDELIPGNRGIWSWSLDVHGSSLQRPAYPASAEGGGLAAAALRGVERSEALRSTETLDISIEQLTGWLFGYCTLEEALGPESGEPPFWCRYVRPIRGVFLDEIV